MLSGNLTRLFNVFTRGYVKCGDFIPIGGSIKIYIMQGLVRVKACFGADCKYGINTDSDSYLVLAEAIDYLHTFILNKCMLVNGNAYTDYHDFYSRGNCMLADHANNGDCDRFGSLCKNQFFYGIAAGVLMGAMVLIGCTIAEDFINKLRRIRLSRAHVRCNNDSEKALLIPSSTLQESMEEQVVSSKYR